MSLLSGVGRLVNPRNSTGTPRVGAQQLKARLAEIEKENADLRQEVSRLKTENEAIAAMVTRMLSAKSAAR